MFKIKDNINLKELGFREYYSELEPVDAFIKDISQKCFIAIRKSGRVEKWQSATRKDYYTKFDTMKTITKKDLVKAGLIGKVVEDETE